MTFLLNSLLAVAVFAVHVAVSSVATTGVALHPLAMLTVVLVWRDEPRVIAYQLLPAAFLVDLLQPSRMPVTVLTVLAVWGVAALIQRYLLTNHSLASLGGMAVSAAALRVGVVWLLVTAAAALGVSKLPVNDGWAWRVVLLRFAVESGITIGIGGAWRAVHRRLRQRFIYGTR